MSWLFVPPAIALAIATLISASLAVIAWRRRRFRAENLFFWLMVGVTGWTFAYTLEAAVVEHSAKLLFTQIGYFSLVVIPPLILSFVWEYAEHKHPPLFIAIPAYILSAITLVLVWTHPQHNLMWSGFSSRPAAENVMIYHHGVWFWVYISYFYAVILICLFILARRWIYSSSLDRRKMGVMIIGCMFPALGGTIYTFNLGPYPYVDYAALSTTIMNVIYAWNLFRFHMLDLVPVARGNIFERLDEGIIVLNTQAQIVDINPAAENLFDMAGRNVIGLSIEAVSPLLDQFINRTIIQDQLVQIPSTSTWLNLHAYPLTDRRGTLLGNLIIIHDVTERLQAEERITILSQALEFSPAPVLLMDRNGMIEYVNPSFTRLYGYSTEESKTQNPKIILDSGVHAPEFYENIWELMDSGQNWQGEICNRTKNGELKWVFVTISPIVNQSGQVTHFVAVHIDVSENRKLISILEEAKINAEAATRAKSEFLANMSHEIRTPMNAIIGMTSLLLDTKLDLEQHNYADIIRHSGDTLLALINDILDFSKIEAGKLQLEFAPFELRTAVEEAVDLVTMRAAEKKLELAYHIAPGSPEFVIGDLTRLRQVLVNLFSNAIKFTETGEVFLSVSGQEVGAIADENERRFLAANRNQNSQAPIYRLHFSIIDTGIGIPEEKLLELFHSFTQLDASTTRKYGGTGLGLSISKMLCEMMGGTIWAESLGVPGKGSTFHFTVLVEACADRRTPLFEADRYQFEGRQVLIVDDNATNRMIMQRYVESWKMIPHIAASAAEALQFFAKWNEDPENLDLAMIDMQMPDMDGITLANAIHEQADWQKLPLIMITSLGYNQPNDDPGLFIQYVSKPIKPSLLYNALANALTGQKPALRGRRRDATVFDAEMGRRHPLRLLLAEDNVINQKVVTHQLQRLGYRIDIAANGLEVLQALHRQSYDVIFMDVHMPEMDGLEATRRICQEWPAAERPRIIAMTANAMSGDREICLSAGMEDYLSKPVQIQELVRALEACEPRQAHRIA